ncbi:MAG TPA: DUF4197 domain-containing protein [Terriglobales bacterium]|jgi:hypothetical protein|nr:DUF4197 domain-containing protein [Terriglobales bacterium]
MRRIVLVFLFALCVDQALAQSSLEQIWRSVTKSKGSTSVAALSNEKIVSGLKEALKLSTGKAVASTGKPDGFFRNEAIKILLPEKLRTAGRGMRLIGMGPQLDQLEVGMNRAAEQATPLAKEIFLNALYKMSFDDARGILSGGDHAATDYFRRQSSAELSTAFKPIVHRTMEQVGVIRQYNQLSQNSVAGPLLKAQGLDMDEYVLGKTLDGLFYVLAQEEKNIRKDPAARTTDLLREVFGARQ